jgi:hypothetical protein
MGPLGRRARPAASACLSPFGDRGTSSQPVKRRSALPVDSPWRTKNSRVWGISPPRLYNIQRAAAAKALDRGLAPR